MFKDYLVAEDVAEKAGKKLGEEVSDVAGTAGKKLEKGDSIILFTPDVMIKYPNFQEGYTYEQIKSITIFWLANIS